MPIASELQSKKGNWWVEGVTFTRLDYAIVVAERYARIAGRDIAVCLDKAYNAKCYVTPTGKVFER